jgi:DNA-directed RNA polymerase alpha subunit
MDPLEILSKPITELGLSGPFCEQSKRMGFDKLEDICLILPEQLVKTEGFTYAWLGELIDYLDRHQLLYLLQPIPGKNYG